MESKVPEWLKENMWGVDQEDKTPRCEICFFWRRRYRMTYGDCHYRSPVCGQKLDLSYVGIDFEAAWPITGAALWCGDFKSIFSL